MDVSTHEQVIEDALDAAAEDSDVSAQDCSGRLREEMAL